MVTESKGTTVVAGLIHKGPTVSYRYTTLLDATHGWVKADSGMTSLEGIWAAGNVISSPDQMPQAMGAGAAVAIKVDQKMFDEDISG